MEPRAHHILVGFFTLFTAAALLGFALWLSKSGSEGERVAFDIIFEEDVKGLTEGSSVLYTGIPVGEVISLKLDPKDPSKVWTRISIDRNTPMRTTTTARMSLANITGSSVILLENADPTSAPLVSKDDNIPVLTAKTSPFTKLQTSGEELLANITRLVDNANDFLSGENSSNITKILQNFEQTTGALAAEKDSISQGIQDLAAASKELRNTVTQSSTLLTDFNEKFGAQGSDLLAQADRSLESLATLSGNISELVEDNSEALSQSIYGLAEIGPVLTKLEELIGNLNDISRQLEEDPSGYLLGGEKFREYQQ